MGTANQFHQRYRRELRGNTDNEREQQKYQSIDSEHTISGCLADHTQNGEWVKQRAILGVKQTQHMIWKRVADTFYNRLLLAAAHCPCCRASG